MNTAAYINIERVCVCVDIREKTATAYRVLEIRWICECLRNNSEELQGGTAWQYRTYTCTHTYRYTYRCGCGYPYPYPYTYTYTYRYRCTYTYTYRYRYTYTYTYTHILINIHIHLHLHIHIHTHMHIHIHIHMIHTFSHIPTCSLFTGLLHSFIPEVKPDIQASSEQEAFQQMDKIIKL